MHRSLVQTAAVLLLVALCVAPAGAQDIGSMALGAPLRISGTVAAVNPENLVLNYQGGQVVVPLAYARLTTRPLPGVALTLTVGPFQGTVTTCDERWVSVNTTQGVCTLPVAMLPPATTQKTRVYVRKKNGKVVDVPLNAALNMQRAQGAVILGSSQGVAVPAVPVYTEPDHGPGNSGKSQGKGHGKGH